MALNSPFKTAVGGSNSLKAGGDRGVLFDAAPTSPSCHIS